MQIRLYIDEDAMSRELVNGLRARGIDVATVGEEGKAGLEDTEQLAFAASQGRVVYTFNVSDFYRIHTEYLAQGRSHAGIILVPQQLQYKPTTSQTLNPYKSKIRRSNEGQCRVSEQLGVI